MKDSLGITGLSEYLSKLLVEGKEVGEFSKNALEKDIELDKLDYFPLRRRSEQILDILKA